MEELFGNPIQRLCWIEFQKVGAIAFPKRLFTFLNDDSSKTIDNIMIRCFEPALLDELLHGLHAEAYEIDRVGNAESEPNVKVVEDRLGRIDGLAL